MTGERFPWAAFMQAGLGTLGLSPRAFWAATPREIRAAFGPALRGFPAREEMERLMQRYPDET